MTTEVDQMERVKGWLRARNPDCGEIDLDMDLIDNRLVDSLAFTEFLLFLEGLVGREIVLTEESVVALRTLGGIRQRVLQGGAS
jgi:acyl carrier protein